MISIWDSKSVIPLKISILFRSLDDPPFIRFQHNGATVCIADVDVEINLTLKLKCSSLFHRLISYACLSYLTN